MRTSRAAGVEVALRHGFLCRDADAVLDVPRATHGVGDVFGAVLHPAGRHPALHDHASLFAVHFDVGGVDDGVVAQSLVHVFQDALVRTYVAARAAAAVGALGLGAVGPLPAAGCLLEVVMVGRVTLATAFAAEAVAAGQEAVAVGAMRMLMRAWVRATLPPAAALVRARVRSTHARIVIARLLRCTRPGDAAGFGERVLVRCIGAVVVMPMHAIATIVEFRAATFPLVRILPLLSASGGVQPFAALLQVLCAGLQQAFRDRAEFADAGDFAVVVRTPGPA